VTTNTDNLQYLATIPAYPSGHAVYGYMEALLLALLVQERYQQMVTRAAEHGNDRIVLGAHYAMDALGDRTLAMNCGGKIADCAAQDQSRFADPAKNSVFYVATQTYGLPVVFANNAEGTEDVAKLAPEAGYLLTTAFPSLTLAQADAILTQTEGPGGGFLDNGAAFGVYSRGPLQGGRASCGAFCKGKIGPAHPRKRDA
jgi:hypothetical protein